MSRYIFLENLEYRFISVYFVIYNPQIHPDVGTILE